MKPMPSYLTLVCRYALILAVPVFLTLVNVRLLMTPAFPEIEYRLPNFPADSYGFTREDRLHRSKIAIDYLLNAEGVEFLGDLRFPDGQQAPPASQQYYLPPRDATYAFTFRSACSTFSTRTWRLALRITARRDVAACFIRGSVCWLASRA